MSKIAKDVVSAVLALALGLIFAISYVVLLMATFGATSTPPVPADLEKLMIASSTGVAGVIAFWLGVSVPAATNVRGRLSSLGGFIDFGLERELLQVILGVIFSGGYIVITVLCLIAWATNAPFTPEVIKSQVYALIALSAAAASGLMKQ